MVLGTFFSIIVLFASLYYFLNIDFNHGKEIIKLSFFDSLYFSVVTITTLGYGDISPARNLGKFLIGIEAISGILILGLYLNSLSHRLAINYQSILKEEESIMAIKLIATPNWHDIGAYSWNLKYAHDYLNKIKFLKKETSNPEQLISFKQSIEEFNHSSRIYLLQKLESDKAKSFIHLEKFLVNIDPVRYSTLLYHINFLHSRELHIMQKNYIEDIKNNLDNYNKSEHSIYTTSSFLQGINEWIDEELKSMSYIEDTILNIIKDKTK